MTVKIKEESDRNARLVVAEKGKYCLTPHCVHTTSRILNYMDRTIHPCNDFWRYACGGWLKAHANEPDDFGVDVLASKNVYDKVQSIIEQGRSNRVNEVTVKGGSGDNAGVLNGFQWKLQTLYLRCNDTKTVDSDGASEFSRIVKDFGGWSVFGTKMR
jgi:predicted metalloendopeptidase